MRLRKKQRGRVPKGADIEKHVKVGISVYGKTVKEGCVDRPFEITERDRRKGIKIAQKHQLKMKRQAKRAARRGGCLGCCISLLGAMAIPVLLIGLLLTMIL